MRIAVLADTHAPRFWKRCPPAVAAAVDGVDLILHAGDVCTAAVLHDLEARAPVCAVMGNNDDQDVAAWGATDTLELELAGLNLAMVHDSGPARGRSARLRRRFPAAGVVIFGHSHVPWDETVDGQRCLNPGSPTDRRRQPRPTMAQLVIRDGAVVSARIFPVD